MTLRGRDFSARDREKSAGEIPKEGQRRKTLAYTGAYIKALLAPSEFLMKCVNSNPFASPNLIKSRSTHANFSLRGTPSFPSPTSRSPTPCCASFSSASSNPLVLSLSRLRLAINMDGTNFLQSVTQPYSRNMEIPVNFLSETRSRTRRSSLGRRFAR